MKVDLSKYILRIPQYGYGWVYAHDQLCMLDVLVDKMPIKDVFEKKSIRTLRKNLNSKVRDWVVLEYSDYTTFPNNARVALDEAKDIISEGCDAFIAQRVNKDKKKKILAAIHKCHASQIEEAENKAKEERYRWYLELRKEFEGK